jgi:hypothetical protein
MTEENFIVAISGLATAIGILWGAVIVISNFVKKLIEEQIKEMKIRISSLEVENEKLKIEIQKRDIKIDNLTTAIYDLAMATRKTKKIDEILERVKKL